MTDDNDLIRDAEGARILGIGNPMNDGEPPRDQFAQLLERTQHTGAEVMAMLLALSDLPEDERQYPLLATQDRVIHLLLEVHGLIHALAR